MIPIKPTGYRLLVKQVAQEQKSKGGILLVGSDEEHRRQQAGFPIYEILDMGTACYKSRDGQEFPEGKWCEVGDIVLMDAYAGKAFQPKEFERFNEEDEEAVKELKEMESQGLKYHLVNDDAVLAKVTI